MIDAMSKNQRYMPDYGYTAPKRTRTECKNPAFMDRHYHRVGYFRKPPYYSDGLPGYVGVAKCVNCGHEFESDSMFFPSDKRKVGA